MPAPEAGGRLHYLEPLVQLGDCEFLRRCEQATIMSPAMRGSSTDNLQQFHFQSWQF